MKCEVKLNKITNQISVELKEDLFFVEHISEDGKTGNIVYSDSIFNKDDVKIGLLDQILLARAWLVCTSTADVLCDYKRFEGKQRNTLKVIADLNDALLYLGGEKYNHNVNFSGNLIKNIEINIENKNYVCKCDIKWELESYELEMPNLLYVPKFSWWSAEEEKNNQYTNRPLFKKAIEFNTLYSEDWVKILNGRDFHKFLEDMIKKYD